MKFLVSALVLCFALSASAQKVKYKKGLFSVGDVEYLKGTCDHPINMPCVFVSVANNSKIFSTQLYPYTYMGRKHVGNGRYVNEEKTGKYYLIKFLGQGKEINTTGGLKLLVKNMFTHGLITEAGDLDLTKLDEFIEIYGEKNPNAIEIE